MKHLKYSALTSGGRAFDIEFPLHPQTRSPEAVSSMITGLLEALTTQVQAQGDISDGDVLQALAMTLAVRARMVDAAPESTLTLVQNLVEKAHQAAQQAASYEAARG